MKILKSITIIIFTIILFCCVVSCGRRVSSKHLKDTTKISKNESIKSIKDIVLYETVHEEGKNYLFYVLEYDESGYTLLLPITTFGKVKMNDHNLNVDSFEKTDLYQYLNGDDSFDKFKDIYLPITMRVQVENVNLLSKDYISNNFSNAVIDIILKDKGDFWLSSKNESFFDYVMNDGYINSDDAKNKHGLLPILKFKTYDLIRQEPK